MKYPILLSYFIVSFIVVAIPFPWWYYSVGGIFQIYDSPFQVSIIMLGDNLLISLLVSLFLNAFRIYVAINLIYGIILVLKGKVYGYSTMFWLPIFYILDPIIIYFIINYLVTQLVKIPIQYPLLIIGEETLYTNYQGASISMIIISEPTILFWISLIPVGLYVGYLIRERKKV